MIPVAIWLLLALTVSGQEYEENLAVGGYRDEAAPDIILNPDPVELTEGSDLYSRCSVLEDPETYTYRWVRRLPDRTTQELSTTAVLFIPTVRFDDLQHPIYCEVTRLTDGDMFEKLLNLRVEQGSAPQTVTRELQLIIRSLPAENLSQGQIMRQCMFAGDLDVNAEFDFRWLDQSGRVVTSGDSLIVMLTNLADLRNYTCEATHRQTGEIFQAKFQVAEYAADSQFEISIQALTPELLVGRPYEMACEVHPPPGVPIRYRWYHNGRVVGESSQHRVPSLSYPDIGTYICRAEWTPPNSRTGSIGANATIELTLALTQETKIEMINPPGSILVTVPGVTRELHCEFDMRNPQMVRWSFERQPLEFHPTLNVSGNVHRVDRQRVSIVTLRGVELGHMGTYECQVNGDIKQTHVVVRAEKGLDINPETDTVDEGSPVEFHCQAHGADHDVNREMQWFFRPFYGGAMVPLDLNSRDGFVRHDDPYASHTSFVSKMRTRKSDEGEYICRLPSQGQERVARLYVRSTGVYRVVITPSIIRVRVGQSIEMECYVTEDSGRPAQEPPKFRLRDPRILYRVDRVSENRARFVIPDGLQSEFNGTEVECYMEGTGAATTARIIVESTCPQGYRRCHSGQCLPAGRFCDGNPDCADRSDEDPLYCNACDPIAKQCEYYRNQAPIKKTYMIHWACDGEDDCGNGFDEANCPDPSVARCDGTMFTCQSSGRRIPLAYVCDKDQDCPQGEDERYCTAPTIQATDTFRYPVRRGSQLVLTCRVTGQPLPRVIWRFNWGCLPDEGGRFRVSSSAQNCDSPIPTVISTLTISNVRPGDDGIYNCEGLAGATRAMSNDYVVMLEE